MNALDLVLIVGFATRLARLIIVDDLGERFFQDPLQRLIERKIRKPSTQDFYQSGLMCPFCLGFWTSAAVLGSWALWGDTVAWQLLAGAFTLNYVQGHLNRVLDFGGDDE